MNAIDFLIKEHNKVRGLFVDLNENNHREDTKRNIFEAIRDNLIRHEKMEQTIFYPKLKSNKDLHEKIKHLIDEEKDAKKLIMHLDKIKNSPAWEEELIKLQKDVEHHANEEEKELFPHVRKLIDEDELVEIGKEMREFKENYQEAKVNN
jgi:hemerythrin superfamily protein